jgi:hypothetical protein
MEKPQMISIAGLKARGWTQALITLLGEPDVVGRNSHYAKLAPMRLYDTARVASFEVSSEFLLQKRKLLGVSAEQRLPCRQSARH